MELQRHLHSLIRENITPRGDGNKENKRVNEVFRNNIRENITPRGDGNNVITITHSAVTNYKREYNSERRRKRYQ